MDVALDEQREDWQVGSAALPIDLNDTGDEDGSGAIVSVRTGGSRDVTLTLPDGRRVTFQFYFTLAGYFCEPTWKAPADVNYTLTAANNPYFDGLNDYWDDIGDTSFDTYDFSGYVLTDKNSGTQYKIKRGPENDYFYDPDGSGNYVYAVVYGPPELTEIVERSGATINITPNGIYYADTNGLGREIAITRDAQGRIISISDPNETTNNALPTLQYIYNQSSGNLVQALKLVDSATGLYATNSYLYNNPNFPHYITGIINGDGIP